MTENLNNDEESRLIERLILGEEVCDEVTFSFSMMEIK